MTDPWQIQNTIINQEAAEITTEKKCNSVAVSQEKVLEFEDNFAPNENKSVLNKKLENASNNCTEHKPLPDSASYLKSLERKLQKIQKGSKLVEALGEKRQQCLRTLLQEDEQPQQAPYSNNNELLELDAPLADVDSTVQVIYRHLQPVQALSVGETVHIVNYDQLEKQKQQGQEDATSSSTDNDEDDSEAAERH